MLLGSALVGLAVLAGGFLFRGERAQSVGVPKLDPAAEQAATPDGKARAAVHARSEVGAAGEETAAERLDDERASKLRGTFVMVEADGTERAHESGSMGLELLEGAQPRFARVAIQAGRWSLQVSRLPHRFVCVWAELGGRAAHVADHVIRVPADGPGRAGSAVIRGRWVVGATLRVRSARTLQELDEVTVYANAGDRWDGDPAPRFPRNLVLLGEGMASPVQLPPPKQAEANPRELWVHAPGHAFRRYELDVTDPRERDVLLEPGGEVLLRCAGEVPARAVIRVYRLHDERAADPQSPDVAQLPLWAEARPERAATRLRGLDLGLHWIALEHGAWSDSRVQIAGARVRVRPGEVVSATLQIDYRVAVSAPVPVAGTVRIPDSWRADAELEIRPSRALRAAGVSAKSVNLGTAERLGERSWRWDVGTLPPGAYAAALDALGYAQAFDVTAIGAAQTAILVPEPAECIVRGFDAESGHEVTLAHVEWTAAAARPRGETTRAQVTAQTEAGLRFQTPPGGVQLRTVARGYAPVEQEFVVRPGTNELRLELRRRCGVEIVLRDGARTVEWDDWEWRAELERADGDGGVLRGTQGRVDAPGAGRYRLRVSGPREYATIAEREVVLIAGVIARVEVAVRRER